VQAEYRRFRNPATGQEMEYSATVQLKARAQLTPTLERPEWEDQETDEQGSTQQDRRGSASDRPRSEQERKKERERENERQRLRIGTKSSPEVVTSLLAQRQRLVILGDVGSGKSTLLKRLAHDSAVAYHQGRESRLPILITATRLGTMARQYP